jgi:hypothetical protein
MEVGGELGLKRGVSHPSKLARGCRTRLGKTTGGFAAVQAVADREQRN